MLKVKSLSAISLFLMLGACASQTSNQNAVATINEPNSTAISAVCQAITEQQVVDLFDRWNDTLKTLDSNKVVANYANTSILLPTVSNQPRLSVAEKKDYFDHFLKNKPTGEINQRQITFGCNSVVDSGIYTFTFGTNGAVVPARYTYAYGWDGKNWLITSHHSSAMPEK